MDDFQKRIDDLDPGLFTHVLSQCTGGDKQSLLSLQSAVRDILPAFAYLEIGSYKGGSLQPYVVDPRCSSIISIDPRPYTLADARGTERYPENTTSGMLEALAKIPGSSVRKIRTFEAGTDTLNPSALDIRPDFCFIDGEHTDAAALRDARFCLAAAKPDSIIAFHDANLIYSALDAFIQQLQQEGRVFRPYVLPDSVFVIELGSLSLRESPAVRSQLAENYKAYLAGMLANDWYRYAYHLPIYRFLRRIRRLFPR